MLPPYPWFWHIQAVAKAGRRCHNFVASWQVVSEVFIVIALNLLYRLWNYGWMPNGSTYLEMIPLTWSRSSRGGWTTGLCPSTTLVAADRTFIKGGPVSEVVGLYSILDGLSEKFQCDVNQYIGRAKWEISVWCELTRLMRDPPLVCNMISPLYISGIRQL